MKNSRFHRWFPAFLVGSVLTVALMPTQAEPVVIDLRGERADGTVYFDKEKTYGGMALAAGDLDGNGIDEIILGAPLDQQERGRVVILFNLSLDQVPMMWDLASLPPDVETATILGLKRDDWFGFSLAVGDFNADGRNDLAVGAPNANDPSLGKWELAGIVYVFQGGGTALTPGEHDAGAASIALHGAGRCDGVGTEIAFGDLNGDTIDDLVTTARFGDRKKTREYLDRVYVTYGSLDSLDPPEGKAVVNLQDSCDLFLHSVYSNQFASTNSNSLAVRDVIGDSIPDLIVGCQYGYGRYGWVYVLRGTDDPLRRTINLHKEADIAIRDSYKADYLGATVEAGDIDGDGDIDLVLGASAGYSSQRGEVFLLLAKGKPDPPEPVRFTVGDNEIPFYDLHVIHGYTKYENIGRGLAVDDWNSDGIDDIAVGAIRGRDAEADDVHGRLYLIPGQPTWPEGFVQIDSIPNLVTIIGETKRDEFGMALAFGRLAAGPFVMTSAWLGDGPANARGRCGEVFLFSQWLAALTPTGLRAHLDRRPDAKDLYLLSRRWMTPADPQDRRLDNLPERLIGPEDLREFYRQKRQPVTPR